MERIRLDSLRDLQLFLAVSRSLNMSAAGRLLALSPAQVSKRLQHLEEQLQTRLFYRSTRQLSLTAAGEQLLPYAEQALQLLQEAEGLLTNPGQLSGRLRLTTSVSFGKIYVLPLVEQFMESHPRVQVQMHLDDQNLALVEQGFDLAIRFGEMQDSRLIAQRLFVSRRLLCANPDYLARAGTPVHPRDLHKHRCLLLNQQDQWSFRKDGKEVTIQVQGAISLNSGEVVRDLAAAGRGIAKVAIWHVQDELAKGRLVPVMPDWETYPPLPAWLVYPSQRLQSEPVQQFLHLAQTALKPLGKLGIPERI